MNQLQTAEIRQRIISELQTASADLLIAPLLSLFIGNLLERLDALNNLVETSQLVPAKALAHTIKGSAGMYGFQSIFEFMENFEAYLKTSALAGKTAEFDTEDQGAPDLLSFGNLCRDVLAH